LLKGYPKMLSAVEAGDWAQAAAECARGGIGAARNAWTKQQFLSATIATIKAVAEAEGRSLVRGLGAWFKRVWLRLRQLLSGAR
jgi:hypothetical protein